MAEQWADFPSGDLGLYDTDTTLMLNGIWAEVNTCQLQDDLDPLIGAAGKILRVGVGGLGGGEARFVYSGARVTAGMSCRLWCGSIPAGYDKTPVPFVFKDNANAILACVIVTPTGSLEVRKGAPNGTLVASTAGPVIGANSWTHLSCKATFAAGATGSISIEREGVNILNHVGDVDIGAGPCAQVSHKNQADFASHITEMYIKDTFFWDGLGTANNDHPGSVTVYRRTVDGDVSSGWSRTSGASDYGLLDGTPPDDSQYIYADMSLPAASVMTMQDMPSEVVSIKAVFMVARQQKSDGGDCKTQIGMSSNYADWADGSNRAITTAPTYWYDPASVNPATGLPWTPVEFNNSHLRMNRTL